jgi:hypothetical protein
MALMVAVLFVGGGGSTLGQAGQASQDRIAALKQSLAIGQKQLRQYEWIETTVISVKGEEKSRKQQRCYYGAEGTLQKVPIDSGQAAQQGGGGRGRRGGRAKEAIVEHKKEEMQDYMERAAALVHHYAPPNADLIEKSRAAGKFAVRPGQSGRVTLDFTDYLKAGDKLSIELDGAANRLLSLNVASYLDAPDDVVTLVAQLGALPDGTTYTAQSTLDATAKHVRVVIQNTGHRPMGR